MALRSSALSCKYCTEFGVYFVFHLTPVFASSCKLLFQGISRGTKGGEERRWPFMFTSENSNESKPRRKSLLRPRTFRLYYLMCCGVVQIPILWMNSEEKKKASGRTCNAIYIRP